jgi:hypothetical protein
MASELYEVSQEASCDQQPGQDVAEVMQQPARFQDLLQPGISQIVRRFRFR